MMRSQNKHYRIIVSFAILVFCIQFSFSQNRLIQNKNIRASGLAHSLNKTKDTLVIESKNVISRVELIGRKESFEVKGVSTKVAINLRNYPKDKYTVVAHTGGNLICMSLEIN